MALQRIIFASAPLFLHIFCTAVALLTHSLVFIFLSNNNIILYSVSTAGTSVIDLLHHIVWISWIVENILVQYKTVDES